MEDHVRRHALRLREVAAARAQRLEQPLRLGIVDGGLLAAPRPAARRLAAELQPALAAQQFARALAELQPTVIGVRDEQAQRGELAKHRAPFAPADVGADAPGAEAVMAVALGPLVRDP